MMQKLIIREMNYQIACCGDDKVVNLFKEVDINREESI